MMPLPLLACYLRFFMMGFFTSSWRLLPQFLLVGGCYLKFLPVGGSRYFAFFSWRLTFDDAFALWRLLPQFSSCGVLLAQVSTGGGEPLLHLLHFEAEL